MQSRLCCVNEGGGGVLVEDGQGMEGARRGASGARRG